MKKTVFFGQELPNPFAIASGTWGYDINERIAKEVASQREHLDRERAQATRKRTLESLMESFASGDTRELNVIVKADVQGSAEAIKDALLQLKSDEIKVRTLHTAVGVITENDVTLAHASGAIIVGFNVRADATARKLAEHEGVEIRYYNIIYNLLDDIKDALSGLLSPDKIEEVTGRAEIRALFKFGKTKVAGCYVTEGKIERNNKVRVIRDGAVIAESTIDTLRREKDDAKEVRNGFECGITLANYDDFAEGDELEVFTIKEVAKTFEATKPDAKKPASEAA